MTKTTLVSKFAHLSQYGKFWQAGTCQKQAKRQLQPSACGKWISWPCRMQWRWNASQAAKVSRTNARTPVCTRVHPQLSNTQTHERAFEIKSYILDIFRSEIFIHIREKYPMWANVCPLKVGLQKNKKIDIHN